MRQAIKTKYLAPTNHRGGRIKATCNAKTVVVAWNHANSPEVNHLEAALDLQASLGWDKDYALIGGSIGEEFVFVQVKKD